jgi:predicted kinase
MKIIIVLRGAPGSGKSTFAEAMGLSPFTISSDKLRMQLSSLRLDPTSGQMVIDMTQETQGNFLVLVLVLVLPSLTHSSSISVKFKWRCGRSSID